MSQSALDAFEKRLNDLDHLKLNEGAGSIKEEFSRVSRFLVEFAEFVQASPPEVVEWMKNCPDSIANLYIYTKGNARKSAEIDRIWHALQDSQVVVNRNGRIVKREVLKLPGDKFYELNLTEDHIKWNKLFPKRGALPNSDLKLTDILWKKQIDNLHSPLM
jgi:hypothetical protein